MRGEREDFNESTPSKSRGPAYRPMLESVGVGCLVFVVGMCIFAYAEWGTVKPCGIVQAEDQKDAPGRGITTEKAAALISGGASPVQCAYAFVTDDLQEPPSFDEAISHLRESELDAALEDFRTAREEGMDGDEIAADMLSIGHDEFLEGEDYELAARVFEAAFAFADDQELQHQLHFFAGYAHYEAGKKIDEANTPPQDCESAREASDHLRRVSDALDAAGSYQEKQQGQLRQAVETLLYRQEQIIQKAC